MPEGKTRTRGGKGRGKGEKEEEDNNEVRRKTRKKGQGTRKGNGEKEEKKSETRSKKSQARASPPPPPLPPRWPSQRIPTNRSCATKDTLIHSARGGGTVQSCNITHTHTHTHTHWCLRWGFNTKSRRKIKGGYWRSGPNQVYGHWSGWVTAGDAGKWDTPGG
eukprot:353615-Chlamydomonas_euryale.AAC.5